MNKKFYAILTLAASAFIFASCNNDVVADNEAAPATRTATGIKQVVYIEVNDINPLNAGSYQLTDGQQFYDIAIIFAANINSNAAKEAILHFNDNVTQILFNKDKYIKPLQDKGTKVLLSILGNHAGLGVANMNDAQITAFAAKLKRAVDEFGLDGIDFDDEWAKYGENGHPGVIADSYSKLIKELRRIMPDKMITVFDWGNSYRIDAAATAMVDWAWNGSFGFYSVGSPMMSYLPQNKYAGLSFDAKYLASGGSNLGSLTATAISRGQGAILTYDLRTTNIASYLTLISRMAYGMDTRHDGNTYAKDWPSGGATTDW